MIHFLEGELSAKDMKIAIVVSRWNEFINKSLSDGAVDIFQRLGGNRDHLYGFKVPGAFEIPYMCSKIAEKMKIDGILVIGTVIRGATAHFEYISSAAISGVSQVSLTHKIPVSLGILTTETIEQAIERAGTKAGNKGEEAMTSLIQTISTGRLLK